MGYTRYTSALVELIYTNRIDQSRVGEGDK